MTKVPSLDATQQRCALIGLDDEPLPGTGPHAPHWLLVEDPGPWGRDGLVDGALPASVRAHVLDGVTAHGVRYQALRRVDRRRPARRTVMLANLVDGWMAATTMPVTDLTRLDVSLVHGAAPPEGWDRVTTPVIAVCTHAKRDACCALWGRPLAATLAALAPDAVWETSHTGGHRFAASVLTFPHGDVHGRVSDAAGFGAAIAAGRIPSTTHRGNAAWPRPAQAAEVAVRRQLGLDGVDEVVAAEVIAASDGGAANASAPQAGATDASTTDASAGATDDTTAGVVVTTTSGTHRVVVERVSLPARPTSCGGAPKDPETWQVRSIDGRAVTSPDAGPPVQSPAGP